MKLKVLALLMTVLGGSLIANNAYAVRADEGFYWVCDAATGNYTCGYSSPYGHCRWEDQYGNSGYVATGENIGHFMGYDCREMMPNGPFSAVD